MELQVSSMLSLYTLGNQPNICTETWVDQRAYSDKLPKRKIPEPTFLLLFNYAYPLHTTIFTNHITHGTEIINNNKELWNGEQYNFDPRPIIVSIITLRRIKATKQADNKGY
jgi:hypothetical protein